MIIFSIYFLNREYVSYGINNLRQFSQLNSDDENNLSQDYISLSNNESKTPLHQREVLDLLISCGYDIKHPLVFVSITTIFLNNNPFSNSGLLIILFLIQGTLKKRAKLYS